VVRRAVDAFELGTEEEAAELRSLIEVFNQIHPETCGLPTYRIAS
jgi:hypothetical protein